MAFSNQLQLEVEVSNVDGVGPEFRAKESLESVRCPRLTSGFTDTHHIPTLLLLSEDSIPSENRLYRDGGTICVTKENLRSDLMQLFYNPMLVSVNYNPLHALPSDSERFH
jgi:hypothetical protein